MKNLLYLVFLCPLWLQGQDSSSVIKNARAVYTNCVKGDFAAAASYFDQQLLYRMDGAKLGQTWGLIEGQIGKAIFIEEPIIQMEKIDSAMYVYHSCNFEKKQMDLKLVFNSANKVTGFFFVPPSAKFTYQPPVWIAPGITMERDIDVPSADLILKGKLTVPATGSNFPLVILVQGSGPLDMDVTIGPNKVFKDIAMSLAAKGIAVLRFDKRTKAYMAEMSAMVPYLTPDEEIVQDVVAAFEFSKTLETIDPSSIYILGHSFGGMMGPRIASRCKDVKGLIMMAANARPMQQLILDQLRYVARPDSANPLIQEALANMKVKVDRVTNNDYNDSTDLSLLPKGLGAPFWKYLEAYDPFKESIDLKIPILIVQGERDYEVTTDDFKIWQSKLKSRPKTTFKSYPKLNHLFMAGEGISVPAEYDKRSNVDKSLMDDISEWINE